MEKGKRKRELNDEGQIRRMKRLRLERVGGSGNVGLLLIQENQLLKEELKIRWKLDLASIYEMKAMRALCGGAISPLSEDTASIRKELDIFKKKSSEFGLRQFGHSSEPQIFDAKLDAMSRLVADDVHEIHFVNPVCNLSCWCGSAYLSDERLENHLNRFRSSQFVQCEVCGEVSFGIPQYTITGEGKKRVERYAINCSACRGD